VLRCEPVIWDKDHGIRIELTIKGKYMRGKQSPHDYLRSVAIVNPHAKITLKEPDGSIKVFERVTSKLPKPTIEIKPHPEGIELGTFLKMVKETECYKVVSFLETEFSRTSYRVARDICENAYIDDDLRPKEMNIEQAKRILGAFKHVKIMAPQTECLSPIGETLIKKGLKNVLGTLKPKYYISPVTRKPAVYSGNPFQIEVGMVYGGELPKDQPIQILRFANRVPLLYQQGGCIISTAVQNIDWRRYGFSQPGGYGMPVGPAILLVHVASTKIPFTSEAKEAIADIPEIRNEIEKALKELGRKLQIHLNREVRKQKIAEKFEIVQKVLPIIAEKSSKILGKPVPKLAPVITKIMDIIWVSYTIEYVNPHHIITVEIYNYTSKREKFNLYTVVPPNSLVENSITPSPTKIKENNKIQWHVSINSVEKTTVKFSLYGLDIDEYDDAELYVSGINPAKVVGAEALPGDWELENVQ
jgi:DNA topoisomerase-6 subunit B